MNENRGLWRGKRKVYHNYETNKDVFEWVEGFPIKMWGAVHLQDKEDENLAVPVDPETLGECTGLTDKNGKLIFEGDIIEHKSKRYVIKYIEKYMRFSPVKPGTVFAVFDYTQSEIIGNVHDNPELIQKGAAE